MPNVLESYMVSLGFDVQDDTFRKFQGVLQDAEKGVAQHVSGMARMVLEAQGAITGAFLSISAGIVGLVDKVGMSDQAFRLQGLSMLMSADAARKLDYISKGLGASLKELIWDPELHARAMIMSRDFDAMTEALGPQRFERDMVGVRNIRMEFARLELATKFLGMNFAASLFEKLFPNDTAVHKFSDWIDNFQSKIPAIADSLATYAVPVLKETWQVMAGLGEVTKEGAVAFTNIIAVLSGDESIEGTAFSFEKVAKAIEHVGSWLIRFEGWVIHAEKLLAEFAGGTSLLLSGRFSDAKTEYMNALKDLTPGAGGLLGLTAGVPLGGTIGAAIGTAVAGPVGTVVGAGVGSAVGGLVGAGAGAAEGKVAQWYLDVPKARDTSTESPEPGTAPSRVSPAEQPATGIAERLMSWFSSTATPETQGAISVDGVNDNSPTEQQAPRDLVSALADAITNYESGGKPNARSIRNNNPGNLRSWGDTPVVDGYAKFATWEAGMDALRSQIQKNISRGLTLQEFFAGKEGVYKGFAPSADNNQPAKYAATVGARIHVDTNVPLDRIAAPAAPIDNSRATRPLNAPAPAQSFLQRNAPEAPSWLQSIPPWFAELPAWFTTAPAWFTQTPAAGSATKYADAPDATQKYLAAPQQSIQNYLSPRPSPDVGSTTVTNDNRANIGPITISIMQPNATPAEIQRAAANGIRDAMQLQTQWDLPQLQPNY